MSYYTSDGNSAFPGLNNQYISNFSNTGTVTNPLFINFTSVLSGAAFNMDADVTPYTISALLNGMVVDSFTATIGSQSSSNIYGFQNDKFNQITITQAGVGGGPYYDIDNLQIATASTPEPSSLVLLGTGVLGLIGAAKRRFA